MCRQIILFYDRGYVLLVSDSGSMFDSRQDRTNSVWIKMPEEHCLDQESNKITPHDLIIIKYTIFFFFNSFLPIIIASPHNNKTQERVLNIFILCLV